MATSGSINTDSNADREEFCYITTATGNVVQKGWARHQDEFVGITGQPNVDPIGGIAYFTATVPVTPLNISQAGFQIINCDSDIWTADLCETVTTTQLQQFAYTGALQDATPPVGANKVRIQAWGAGGGRGAYTASNVAVGGGGGYAEGTLRAQALKILVGQGGFAGGSATAGTGNFGGGGSGGVDSVDERSGSGGGGLSGAFIGSATQANALVIAGGGGGGGGWSASGKGGSGGGLKGGDAAGGKGGTQTAGGISTHATTSRDGYAGSAMQGGNGGIGNPGGGGGGGGGYFGGGGGYGHNLVVGGHDDTAGGGGSGYVKSSALPSINTAGTTSVVANNTDPNRVGTSGNGATTVATAGNNGQVAVTWITESVNKFQRVYTTVNGVTTQRNLRYDGTVYTVVNEANVGPCCCEEEEPDTYKASVIKSCADVGSSAETASELLANGEFENSVVGQTTYGPTWASDYPIVADNTGQDGNIALITTALGTELRTGPTLVGQRIVGWNSIYLEQNRTYIMKFTQTANASSNVQWRVGGVLVGTTYGNTSSVPIVRELNYSHTLATGNYNVDLVSNTGATSGNDQSFTRFTMLKVVPPVTPDITTEEEYTSVVKSVIDQIVKVAGCKDDRRDDLLQDIVDAVNAQDGSNTTTANGTIGTLRATTNGSVVAGKQSVSFTALQGSPSVNGAVMNVGQSISFESYLNPVTNVYTRLPLINYTASAANVLFITWID